MTAPAITPPAGGGDAGAPPPEGTPRPRGATGAKADAAQQLVLAAILLGVAVAFWFVDSLSESALMIALTGVVISIAASAGLFVGANGLASLLPDRIGSRIRPWIFVGPALLFIFVTLVVPTVRTLYLSVLDNRGEEVVGLDQYADIFTSEDIFGFDGISDMFTSRLFLLGLAALAVAAVLGVRNGRAIGTRLDLSSAGTTLAIGAGVTLVLFALFSSARGVIWNNLWWVFAVTAIATALGLAVAVLADRVKGEAIAKALIFLPMAISFVGASIIWRFVYAFRPQTSDQIGVLNAVWRGLGGAVLDPLQARPWNTFFLIMVLIWGQTGFAMVVLSSAIKAVPDEYIEAARVDGATESQIFWRIILPQIRSTILVVVTTLIILVMKVFDIVKVMTNGEFGTNVIANEMFDQAFRFGNVGLGAALASVLFLAVLPLMYVNVRRVREEAEL